jgi:hypothetical protein
MAAWRDTLLPLGLAAAVTACAHALGRPLRARDVVVAAAVFVVTGLWDVVLRDLSEGNLRLAGAEDWAWVRDLRPYFASHSIVGAAGIAGAVGVLALSIIRLVEPRSLPLTVLWVGAVSVVVGLPMRVPGWFTELQAHYYDKHPYLTYATDGLSGLIVWLTLIVLDRAVRMYARVA